MKSLLVLFSFFACAGFISGCGVKGKPLPPLEPAEIGRGAPTYRRAAEQAKPAVVPDAGVPKPSPTPRSSP
ncbi:hypothetical protein BH10BDE1_BH10BDE1_22700 [soil metagenome]